MSGAVVTVTLFGALRRFAQHRAASVDVDRKMTVLDLLESLSARYGPEFADLVFRCPREVHTHARVFINEHEAAMGDLVVRDGATAAEVAILLLHSLEGGRDQDA